MEQAILGACLIENSYPKVTDILSAKNFSKPQISEGHLIDHQEIFKSFERLYPQRPIDLITVCHELPGIAHYLSQLSNMMCSSANICYYALLLLELDIRKNFIQLLNGRISSGQLNSTTATALQEIIDECLDRDADIFGIIEASEVYLQQILANDFLVNDIKEFINNVEKRIQKIKRFSSIETLMNNLTNLSRTTDDPVSQMTLNHLTGIIKAILSKGKVTADFAQQVLGLKF